MESANKASMCERDAIIIMQAVSILVVITKGYPESDQLSKRGSLHAPTELSPKGSRGGWMWPPRETVASRLVWGWDPGGPGPPDRPSGYPTPRGPKTTVLQVGLRDKRVLSAAAQWLAAPLGVAPDSPPSLCRKQHTSTPFALPGFIIHALDGPSTPPLGVGDPTPASAG
ncbi:hypothetical protein FQA39_LY01077 [Lamprigera yunnana]|nr:hypothetical protein FQA39_LY01077 [Lamprigera yunnana]